MCALLTCFLLLQYNTHKRTYLQAKDGATMKNKKFGGLTAAANFYNMIDPPALRSIVSETLPESIARNQAKIVSQCIGTTAISPLATTVFDQTVGAGRFISAIDSLGAQTNFGISSILDIGLSAMDFPHQTHRQELFLQTSFPVDLAVRAHESFQTMMTSPLISTIGHAQTFGSESLGLIRDIVCGFNSWEFGAQLSPLLDIAGLEFDDEEFLKEFLKEHQEECCGILLDMRWCPTALLSLSLGAIIRLSDIISETMEENHRKEAVNQLIFQELGKSYISAIGEDWTAMNLPAHLRRLLKETLAAYRRREHGIVVSVLPTLWEGIIRDKCKIEKKNPQQQAKTTNARINFHKEG